MLSQTPQSFVLGSEKTFLSFTSLPLSAEPETHRNVSTHLQRLFTKLSVLP